MTSTILGIKIIRLNKIKSFPSLNLNSWCNAKNWIGANDIKPDNNNVYVCLQVL